MGIVRMSRHEGGAHHTFLDMVQWHRGEKAFQYSGLGINDVWPDEPPPPKQVCQQCLIDSTAGLSINNV